MWASKTGVTKVKYDYVDHDDPIESVKILASEHHRDGSSGEEQVEILSTDVSSSSSLDRAVAAFAQLLGYHPEAGIDPIRAWVISSDGEQEKIVQITHDMTFEQFRDQAAALLGWLADLNKISVGIMGPRRAIPISSLATVRDGDTIVLTRNT